MVEQGMVDKEFCLQNLEQEDGRSLVGSNWRELWWAHVSACSSNNRAMKGKGVGVV